MTSWSKTKLYPVKNKLVSLLVILLVLLLTVTSKETLMLMETATLELLLVRQLIQLLPHTLLEILILMVVDMSADSLDILIAV